MRKATAEKTTGQRRAKRKKKVTYDVLCAALRLVHDLNVEIAEDPKQSTSERKSAAGNAARAKEDAGRYGCVWAQRM